MRQRYARPMARVPLLHPDDPETPPDARDVLRQWAGSTGRVTNIFRVMANHPALTRAFSDYAAVIYRNGQLSAKERELAYTTATAINNCFY